jgi:hypothetical protein
MVVPRLVASATSGFDSSLMAQRARRVPVLVYIILVISSAAFVLEMSAIFLALIQIRARRLGRYLIVTDSMSSLKAQQTRKVASRTHSLVYEIKEACWWLNNNGYEIHMIPVRSNERADQLAGDAVENGIEWHAPVRPSDFLPLSW